MLHLTGQHLLFSQFRHREYIKLYIRIKYTKRPMKYTENVLVCIQLSSSLVQYMHNAEREFS